MGSRSDSGLLSKEVFIFLTAHSASGATLGVSHDVQHARSVAEHAAALPQ